MKPTLTKRRNFLATASGLGAGAIALQSLIASEKSDHASSRISHRPATAKSVIFLFMSGGPSQVDLFDPKPELARLAGKDVPESIAKFVPKIKRAGLRNLMASPWEFQRHGESGLTVSSLLPETAKHVDDLCLIRSMTHRNPIHGPGECVALTGTGAGDRPSLGRPPKLITDFSAQLPGLRFPLSTLQVRPHGTCAIHSNAAERPHMTRGQRDWLNLHCKTLSFLYFSPTLNGAINGTGLKLLIGPPQQGLVPVVAGRLVQSTIHFQFPLPLR